MERFLTRRKRASQGTKWWTRDCKEKAAAYRQAPKLGAATAEKEALRRATRLAKRDYWQNQIQNANCPADIFKITRWHKNKGKLPSPPITYEDRIYTNPLEKASILRRALLERNCTADDTNEMYNPSTPHRLIVQDSVDEEEVKLSLLHTSNTAAGIDGISVRVLQACWDGIKVAVVSLYQQFLVQGYHPKAFRRAQMVILPKLNKRDLSSVRSWRPIALLSCLGKGLERLIARRITRTALKQRVLSSQKFSALPKRSGLDLVSCLIHEIEKARSRDMVASLLTMDIKGAFDTVLPGRMRQRMCEQGWPCWIVRRVWSFMSNRTASIRFETATTPESPLACGLPQGSPASPILFMLYTEPILRQGDQKMKFSYADNVAILRVGRTLTECTEKLETEARLLLEWGENNAVSFDLKKSELQHFTTGHIGKKYTEIVLRNNPIPANQVTRRLGVLLDRKLTFLHHTRYWATKGEVVVAHLRRLNYTIKGSSPILIRQAVKSCVLPVALYGAEAWWPGNYTPSRKRKKLEEKKHRRGQHLNLISKAMNTGLRAIIPAYKTIPLSALHRKAGIPPAHILLSHLRLRKALRIQTLDLQHPMRKRALGKGTTRLTQTAHLLPVSVDADLIDCLVAAQNPPLASIDANLDVHLYTDGALIINGKAGGGYFA